MIVRDATEADIARVVCNMRDADAREVYAGRFTEHPADLVADLIAGQPFCIGFLALAGDDGAAIGLLGARLVGPTNVDVLMVATEEWGQIARAATRYAIKIAIPCYLGPNVRRAECKAWIGNRVSRAWLAKLGFREEGLLRAYGKKGENFIQYAWLNASFRG